MHADCNVWTYASCCAFANGLVMLHELSERVPCNSGADDLQVYTCDVQAILNYGLIISAGEEQLRCPTALQNVWACTSAAKRL
jgi:hypothetical protein